MAVGMAKADIESGGSKARMEARTPTRDINIADAMCDGGEMLGWKLLHSPSGVLGFQVAKPKKATKQNPLFQASP